VSGAVEDHQPEMHGMISLRDGAIEGEVVPSPALAKR
jgi:hypothetical protein